MAVLLGKDLPGRMLGTIGHSICRNPKPYAILAACCAMLLVCYSRAALLLSGWMPGVTSGIFLLLLLAALLMALPGRIWLLCLPTTVGTQIALASINEKKIAAMGLPVTAFDVRMFIEDPSVLLNALGRGPTTVAQWLLLAALLMAGIVAAVVILARRFGVRIAPRAIASSLALIIIVVASGFLSLGSYGRLVSQELTGQNEWQDFWLPEAQVELSRRLGTVEYLAFTYVIDQRLQSTSVIEVSATSEQEIQRAATELSLAPQPGQSVLPNIVFLHAESSFDPNAAFHLSSRADLPLWSGLPETKLLSPLHVNVLGGGSWVTEFEVLTGIDSRVFGYQGYYTHYYIAPQVKTTFVTYLKQKGYRSAAFYPAENSFFNAGQAFQQYGFDDFVDSEQLGLPTNWSAIRDTAIVNAVIDRGVFEDDGPFFYFVSTMENHGPHPCKGAAHTVTFSAPAPQQETCQLNEYIHRAGSTSAAFEAILKQLQANEHRTGRPFVLLVYGDHQPWSFTDGMYSVAGGIAKEEGHSTFAKYRTEADGYQTFVHILGSDAISRRPGFEQVPPAWFLPTLASSFVATSIDDLYMPADGHVFLKCGPDILHSDCDAQQIAAAMRAALLRKGH